MSGTLSRVSGLVTAGVAAIMVISTAAYAQDFSGTFTFSWGELRLVETGGSVSGTYTKGNSGGPGRVTGQIRQAGTAKYVTGEYRDDACSDSGCRGTIQLKFPHYPDMTEMEFQYMPSYSSSWSRLWAKRPSGGDKGAGPGSVAPKPPARPGTDIVGTLKDKLLGGSPGGDRIVVPGGDAGTTNNDAAAIRYHCRINGALAQGDYDAYAFDFPGGDFRAESSGSLNLVADLIRASDGEMLARSGVDTQQFLIDGPLPAGRYILQVRVMHHAGGGPYSVMLGQPGACVVEETATGTGSSSTSQVPDATLGLQVEPATGTFANIGLRVTSVTRGGNAERAGLRVGDVMLSIDQTPMRSPADGRAFTLAPGRTVSVVVVRNDRVIALEVGVASR